MIRRLLPATSRTSIVLLVVALVAIVVRAAALAEPLGIDQSLWASAVYGMGRGQVLYVDVWEQRPPGIYLTYLVGFWLFGWREAAVAWLDVLAALATTVLLWRLGRRLGNELAGAVAACLFAALTLPAGLYGYGGFLERSVCETFIVVCVAAAALAGARLRDEPSAGVAAWMGVCGGLAVLYKPNAAVYLPAIALWWVLLLPAAERTLATIVRMGAWMAAGAVLPIALTMMWIQAVGATAEARVAVVDFNRYYVSEGLATFQHFEALAKAVWLRMKTDPVWAGGVAAALAACVGWIRTRRVSPLAALAICWGGAAVLVIFVNGVRLFNSYFLQAHAPLCLAAAWALAGATNASSATRVWRVGLAVVMLALLVTGPYPARLRDRTVADWQHLAGQTARIDYLEDFGGYANGRGYSARANQEVADYLSARTTPDETVFLFGVNGAGVYFLADRLTAHRFLRLNFFYPDGFPDPRFTVEAVTADLAERRPRYVLFENLHATSAIGRGVSGITREPSVLALLDDYTLEAQIEDFTLYRRR